MEMTGEQLIPLPQAATWKALNDPAVLKDCIPGCESIESVGDNEYEVVLTAKVGPVSAKFKGRMKVSDADPPAPTSCVSKARAASPVSPRAKQAWRSRPKATTALGSHTPPRQRSAASSPRSARG